MKATIQKIVKFCTENTVEMHKSKSGVRMFLYHFELEEFMKIFGDEPFLFDESGIGCVLKEHYLSFELADFLPDLEPDEIQKVLKLSAF